ncbi:MAG: hypothetical protein WBB29_20550 [Geitlerinemataceae cyanobacterium]
MTYDPPELQSLVDRSQKELLSPYQFYSLCEEVRRQTGLTRLYFGTPNLRSVKIEDVIGIREFRVFLDSLALYICALKSMDSKCWIYLSRTLNEVVENQNISVDRFIKIEVSLVGKGAIGKVARLRINDREDLAFKVFFEPDFVWQHGPWAEIPVGIHMKYRKVTRNMAEFLFAGQDWAVWEWIAPNVKPDDRPYGIAYEDFAQKEGLTPLNPLNLSNYNLYGIRLDPGGIQKNYFGRRSIDIYQSLLYYVRRFQKEGWSFLALYLNRKTLNYSIARLITPLFHRFRRLSQTGK